MSLPFPILNLQPSAGGNDLLLGLGAKAGAAGMTSLDPRAERTLTKVHAVHLNPARSPILQLFLSDAAGF